MDPAVAARDERPRIRYRYCYYGGSTVALRTSADVKKQPTILPDEIIALTKPRESPDSNYRAVQG